MEAQTLAGCLALGTTQPQGPPRPPEDPDLRSAENTTLSLIRPGSLSPPCSCDHHIRCQECRTLPICPANTTCVKAQLKRDMLRDAPPARLGIRVSFQVTHIDYKSAFSFWPAGSPRTGVSPPSPGIPPMPRPQMADEPSDVSSGM